MVLRVQAAVAAAGPIAAPGIAIRIWRAFAVHQARPMRAADSAITIQVVAAARATKLSATNLDDCFGIDCFCRKGAVLRRTGSGTPPFSGGCHS